jgi:RNA polymerase sigma-70 factor (ECF subfamily)
MAMDGRVPALSLVSARRHAGPADADLVLALQAGHVGAFDPIWTRYSVRVSSFLAHSLGRPRHEVEDLTQEVFLRVFIAGRRIRKPSSLRYFVMSVAAKVFKGQLRYARTRRFVRLTRTGDIPDVAVVPGGDEEFHAAEDARKRCHEILRRAHTRERVAFMSRYFEDMNVPEVADRLGISVATVKRLSARALKKVSARASFR